DESDKEFFFYHSKPKKSKCFFLQAEDGIRDFHVTGVQTCALPIFFLLNSLIVVSVSFHCRSFALKAQDRAVRAEENFRYFILTEIGRASCRERVEISGAVG